MKFLLRILGFQFLSLLVFLNAYANSKYSIEGSSVYVKESFCESYFDLLSTEAISLNFYETILDIYNKAPDGSDRKAKYKLRLETASTNLNKITQLKLDHLNFPVASVKISINQDILVPKIELVAPGQEFILASNDEDGLGNIILNEGLQYVIDVRGLPACEFFKQNGGDLEDSILRSLDRLLN